jgi:hypothetical protein
MAMDGPLRLTRNLFFEPDWMSFKGMLFFYCCLSLLRQPFVNSKFVSPENYIVFQLLKEVTFRRILTFYSLLEGCLSCAPDSSMTGPGSQIGPFRIEQELGRGGMGVVYLAHDTKLDRHVAIKSIPPELTDNPKARSRFSREARVLASLNHPNRPTKNATFTCCFSELGHSGTHCGRTHDLTTLLDRLRIISRIALRSILASYNGQIQAERYLR